jgi:hypothetical protein
MKFFLTILCLISTTILFAEKVDTIKHLNRHQFSFEFGIQQRSYFGDSYISPGCDTIIPREIRMPLKDYYGFSYNKSISWHLGILYYFKLNQKLKLNSGIEFINRKTILTSDPDSVIKYKIPYSITKFVFNDKYFEIPIFIEYPWKRFNFDFGGSFSIYCFINNKGYSIDGTKYNLHNHWNHNIFYPAFRFSYQLILTKNFNFLIYSGIEYLSGAAINTSSKAFDFRIGTALLY